MKPRHALVFPGRPEWLWVTNAYDGTALRGRADRALHDFGFGLTKFPPAIGAPRVPVPTGGGDLDAGKDSRKSGSPWSVCRLMADIVGVRYAEGVETRGARRIGPLD